MVRTYKIAVIAGDGIAVLTQDMGGSATTSEIRNRVVKILLEG